jgi:plasmid stability protein
MECMADLTIENIDEATLAMLRIRAAKNGRSMEEEARERLTEALAGAAITSDDDLVSRIRRRVEPFGGFDLELPERLPPREPPDFS